jgi:hypothetical protein
MPGSGSVETYQTLVCIGRSLCPVQCAVLSYAERSLSASTLGFLTWVVVGRPIVHGGL